MLSHRKLDVLMHIIVLHTRDSGLGPDFDSIALNCILVEFPQIYIFFLHQLLTKLPSRNVNTLGTKPGNCGQLCLQPVSQCFLKLC